MRREMLMHCSRPLQLWPLASTAPRRRATSSRVSSPSLLPSAASHLTPSPHPGTVPEVSPYSAIYFLQFQPAGNASAYEWTTRFLVSAWSSLRI